MKPRQDSIIVDSLWGFFFRSIGSKEQAEQLLENFLSNHVDWQAYNPDFSTPAGFLLRAARKTVKEWHDNNNKGILPESILEVKNHELTDAENSIFTLLYYRGYTIEDIAGLKGWPLEEAKQTCRQILKKAFTK